MKRIPGMPLNSAASYRRLLIAEALGGLCAHHGAGIEGQGYPGPSDRQIARAAICLADEVIALLAERDDPEGMTP